MNCNVPWRMYTFFKDCMGSWVNTRMLPFIQYLPLKNNNFSLQFVPLFSSIEQSASRLTRLMKALHDVVLSLTEILCYSMMILNQLVHGSILAMPFPISVFLWAMMSMPRPSTAYWTIMIIYTEVIKLS